MFRYRKSIIPVLAAVLLLVLFATPAQASENFAILTLEQQGADYVFLEWNAYDDADGYALYRSEDNESFRLIKSVTSSSTYNYGLVNGKTYSYLVRPYVLDSVGKKQYLDASESRSIQIGVNPPSDLIATAHGKTAISVSWKGDHLADCYVLYRSTDNTNWTLVKRVYGVSTTTYGLTEGETYFFRVKAVRSINGIERFSDYSNSVECTLGIASPDYLTVKPIGTNSVELEWAAVSRATGYRLYRADHTGEYTLIKTITGTTTRNYNLDADDTYTYRIAAIAENGTHTFKSQYTDSNPVRLSLDPVKNIRIEKFLSGGVQLHWDAVEGATGYRLYRTGEDGATALVKTIPETQTNTFSLAAGQCYRFYVKPIYESSTTTINGSSGDGLNVFFHVLPRITVSQSEVNKIHLNWNDVPGADKYRLSISQAGDTKITKELSESETEFELSASGEIAVSLQPIKEDAETIAVEEAFVPVYEDTLSFAIANAIDTTQISLAWEPVTNADQYEVQRFSSAENTFSTLRICTDTSLLDTELSPGTEYQYRYRARYSNYNQPFWGNWSEIITVTTPGSPKYRALLIGEENYDTVLNGPLNDIAAMDNMLSGMTTMDWDVYCQADATLDEIAGLISLAFSGASESDVSLFYYSGHGVTGSGDYYSGALMTVDYNYIPMQDLAELLAAVPGKVIVVLDSCGSGAAISGGTDTISTFASDAMTDFDPDVFNTQVVQIFSAYNEKEQSKSAELATDKFYVLTSSAYEQNSRSVCIDDVWGGVFTRAFVGCVGYDFNSQRWSELMPADKNSDNCATLNECYAYCYDAASEYQDVQVYPLDSSAGLFYK